MTCWEVIFQKSSIIFREMVIGWMRFKMRAISISSCIIKCTQFRHSQTTIKMKMVTTLPSTTKQILSLLTCRPTTKSNIPTTKPWFNGPITTYNRQTTHSVIRLPPPSYLMTSNRRPMSFKHHMPHLIKILPLFSKTLTMKKIKVMESCLENLTLQALI